MTIQELLILHEDTCERARETLKVKNNDYAGGGNDRFANFRGSEFFGVPMEIGILMRTLDKFKRIETFVRTGNLQVKEESVNDAIEDSINYLILLKGVIESRADTKNILIRAVEEQNG